MVAAAGTLHAIAQAFGKKGNHAMRSFQRSLSGSSDGADMSKLRGRINSLLELPNAKRRAG